MQLGLEKSQKKKQHDANGLLSVSIMAVNAGTARADMLQTAQEDIERGHLDHAVSSLETQEGLQNIGAAVSDNEDILESLATVMEKVQVIAAATANAVDAFAKVNIMFAFLRILLTLMSSVGSSIRPNSMESPELSPPGRQYLVCSPYHSNHLRQAYEKQKETDANVIALFKQMKNLYSFVDDLDDLSNKITRLERTIVRVLEQTTECGIFLREYTEHGFIRELRLCS